jgi:hypothetical protein
MSSSGIDHIPLSNLGPAEVERLVMLLKIAISSKAPRVSLSDADRTEVDGLVQQTPVLLETLQLLGLHERTRILGRAPDTLSRDPDEIFRLVLSTLWLHAVEPVIKSLVLKVSSRGRLPVLELSSLSEIRLVY